MHKNPVNFRIFFLYNYLKKYIFPFVRQWLCKQLSNLTYFSLFVSLTAVSPGCNGGTRALPLGRLPQRTPTSQTLHSGGRGVVGLHTVRLLVLHPHHIRHTGPQPGPGDEHGLEGHLGPHHSQTVKTRMRIPGKA